MPAIGNIVKKCSEKITIEGSKKSRKVYKGDIILSNSMSYGKPYILDIEGFIHDGWFVIRDYEKYLYKNYLCHLLNSPLVQKQYASTAAGGVVKNISSELVNSVKVNLPSIDEQIYVSKFLDLIEERIETQIKIIKEYKTLKDSLNKRLIDNSKGNITLENFIVSNTSNLKESDVLNSKNGIYPVYGANGIIKYIDKYDIDQCSISIVKDGAGVGRLQYHEGKYSIIGTLNYLTSKGLFDLKYIYYAMKNINFKNYVVGTGIPHIYFKDYKKEKIKITTNEEINKIVKILTDIDEYIYLQEKLLDKLMIEKKFLLNNLFV